MKRKKYNPPLGPKLWCSRVLLQGCTIFCWIFWDQVLKSKCIFWSKQWYWRFGGGNTICPHILIHLKIRRFSIRLIPFTVFFDDSHTQHWFCLNLKTMKWITASVAERLVRCSAPGHVARRSICNAYIFSLSEVRVLLVTVYDSLCALAT